MSVLGFSALALAIIGALIPTFGIAFSVVGSLFAFLIYRKDPLTAGMAIGISLANTAVMTPSLMTMDLLVGSSLGDQVAKNSHGLLYWGMTMFHALIWVAAILFRSYGLPEQYEEALRRESQFLDEAE